MSSDGLIVFVRRRLRDIGITQGQLADRAQLSRQSIVKLLSGEVRDPKVNTIRLLARALGVSPVFLMRLILDRNPIDAPVQQMSSVPDDHSAFVRDVTFPNGSIVAPGHRFEKIWEIQDAGLIIWSGRNLRCVSATKQSNTFLVPDIEQIPIPDAVSGSVVQLAVWFTAPITPCVCISVWKIFDQHGQLCFPMLFGLDCSIVVSSA